ncbi:heavy metal-binding domain-containing protein [Flavobacterium sp. N3904]|uniref:heavy metal-binding domain-containing protein n=1 Tax=Flavobacterium sp. N3904 TaxID=2986835 RepID=UPI00222430BD|nr:heavy metal-binding domain-containing protein [Flavobacterium sp. N3904]
MKTLFIALAAFFAIGTAVSAQTTTKTTTTTTKKEVQKTMYTCPMHPKEMSDKKGQCPKCGMDMVATKVTVHNAAVKGSQTSTTVKTKYVCTMDGSTANKPGKCPKCGMAMTEKKVETKEIKQ